METTDTKEKKVIDWTKPLVTSNGYNVKFLHKLNNGSMKHRHVCVATTEFDSEHIHYYNQYGEEHSSADMNVKNTTIKKSGWIMIDSRDATNSVGRIAMCSEIYNTEDAVRRAVTNPNYDIVTEIYWEEE